MSYTHGKGFEWLDAKKLTPNDKIKQKNMGKLSQKEVDVRSMLKAARERLALRLDMSITKESAGYYPLLMNEWVQLMEDSVCANVASEREPEHQHFIEWAFVPMKNKYASVSFGVLGVWSDLQGRGYFEIVSTSHYNQGTTKADRVLMEEEKPMYVEESSDAS